MNEVTFSSDCDKDKTKKKSKGVQLVITFNPLLRDFGNTMHKNLYLLYMDQKAQSVLLPEPRQLSEVPSNSVVIWYKD